MCKLRRILWPGIAIPKKFSASWIICEWTYDKLSLSIRFDPELNTYILGKYDKYMSRQSNSARTIHVFDHLWVKVDSSILWNEVNEHSMECWRNWWHKYFSKSCSVYQNITRLIKVIISLVIPSRLTPSYLDRSCFFRV